MWYPITCFPEENGNYLMWWPNGHWEKVYAVLRRKIAVDKDTPVMRVDWYEGDKERWSGSKILQVGTHWGEVNGP